VAVPPQEAAPLPLGYNAGRVEVYDATVPVSLDPVWQGPEQGYVYRSNVPQGQSELFHGDETLVVLVAGGEHFSGADTSIQAPRPVALRQPGLMTPVQRGAPLDVAWDAGNGDLIVVTVSPKEAMAAEPMEGTAVACTVEDTGSLQVSADLMGELPRNAGGVIVTVTRIRQRRVVVQASETLAVLATTSGGTLANFMP